MDSRRVCGTWLAIRPCPYNTPTRALACADPREAPGLHGEDMGAPRSGTSVRPRAVGASGSAWASFRVSLDGRATWYRAEEGEDVVVFFCSESRGCSNTTPWVAQTTSGGLEVHGVGGEEGT